MPCPWLVEGAAVHNVVLVVIALAIFVTLRDINSSVVAAATGLWLLAIGMFIASNLALQMLKLSEQIAAAATKEQRPPTVAAGRRCWATGRARSSRSVMWSASSLGSSSDLHVADQLVRTARPVRLDRQQCVVGFGYYRPKVASPSRRSQVGCCRSGTSP